MPPTESLTDLGVRDAADALRRRTITSVALVEACLARIRELDPKIQAWAHLDADGALAAARERDAESAAGRVRGPLHGVPVGIKDIIDVAGMPTTAGARAFAHTRPTRDATVVARLRAAGAVDRSARPTPRSSPIAIRRRPVTRGTTSTRPAAPRPARRRPSPSRMVPAALGSQTVGSILRPAAYCGVVGLKGPHGLVPVDGIVPLGWSLDHIGPFARSVADTAVVLGVMAGREIVPTSASTPRLAVARQLFDRADAGLRQHLDAVVKQLAAAGAQVSEVTLPREFGEIHAAGQVILESEAAAYHEAMFAKHAADYGPGFAAMMPIGLKRSAAEYVVANRARHAFRDAVIPLLEAHDALLSPTAPRSGAGRPGLDRRRLALRPVELGGRALDLDADRPGCDRPAAGAAARPGAVQISSGCSAWPRGASGVVAFSGQAGSLTMLDLKIDGGTVIDGTGRAGSRTDVGIRDETIVAVGDLSREPAGNSAQRHRSHGGARLHRHALALRLAPVGQPPRGVEDPPGRDHGGRRQLRVLAGARGDGVRGGSAGVRPLHPDGDGLRVALGRRISAGLRPRRHRAERRPARRPRHAADRRDGLRAAPAHRRRADADAADDGRRHGRGRVGTLHRLIYAPGS